MIIYPSNQNNNCYKVINLLNANAHIFNNNSYVKIFFVGTLRMAKIRIVRTSGSLILLFLE